MTTMTAVTKDQILMERTETETEAEAGNSIQTALKSMAPGVAKAAVAGAIVFAVAQKLAGFPMTIPQFMGGQIATQGGYPESLAGVIGWGVHVGVSLGYAALFALAVHFTVGGTDRAVRWAGSAVIALILAVVSTLITAPAIAITISVLAGNGFPATLPGLNTGWGFTFWNHLGFFAIIWLIIVALPDVLRARR